MKNLLILDVETTGLDPAKDAVIEIGVILFSVEHATAIESYASLLGTTDVNPCESINRIPAAALRVARTPSIVWERVADLILEAEVIVAHNASFDRSFVPPPLKHNRPWVCSQTDIRWPRQTRDNPALVPLALEHDLGVAVAHRSLADCELISRLFTRSRELGHDLNEMLAHAMRPAAEFIALVSFDDREKAKTAGFRWHPEQKQWRRRMAIEDAALLGFQTRAVETTPDLITTRSAP